MQSTSVARAVVLYTAPEGDRGVATDRAVGERDRAEVHQAAEGGRAAGDGQAGERRRSTPQRPPGRRRVIPPARIDGQTGGRSVNGQQPAGCRLAPSCPPVRAIVWVVAKAAGSKVMVWVPPRKSASDPTACGIFSSTRPAEESVSQRQVVVLDHQGALEGASDVGPGRVRREAALMVGRDAGDGRSLADGEAAGAEGHGLESDRRSRPAGPAADRLGLAAEPTWSPAAVKPLPPSPSPIRL